jgi:four helix bundle protein
LAGRDFEELEVYQAAREFRRAVYALARDLPAAERYGLAQQMRRAAVSLTNNIAEGHGTYTFQHNISYLHRARGSVTELRDDLNVCEDEAYAAPGRLAELREMSVRATQLIDGYLRYLRKRQGAGA